MAAFSYFSLSICSSSASRFSSSAFFSGVLAATCAAANPQQRELRRFQSFAVLGRWLALTVALPGVFQNGMLGGQALLRIVKLRGFACRRK